MLKQLFSIPDDRKFKYDMFSSILLLHIFGTIGFIRLFDYNWTIWAEIFALWQITGLGITAGAHRLWAHRSYKAKLPLRIVLMVLNSMANEGPILWWSKDHRVHHKCSDTNADHIIFKMALCLLIVVGYFLVSQKNYLKKVQS